VLNWLTHLIEGSAWAYPAIVALVAMDGLVPMVPGEGAVLTASILAADGHLSFVLVLLSAFLGALGYVGGATFQHSLWKPLLLAAVVATVLSLLGEAYRRVRLRHPAHTS
jgi:membrane protein DedA with SNARE-associated domain